MSTWAELRQEILTSLDLKATASTSSDLRNLVDIKMKRKRDELYAIRPPSSLLVYSSTVDVPSTLSYISIDASGSGDTPGWNLSDYQKAYSLTIGLSDSEMSEEEDWKPVPWKAWIRQNSATFGNQRRNKSFTVDYQKRVYLRVLPQTGDTWKARLHYYKDPGAIVDGSEIEIGPNNEQLLALGVVIQFPNMFLGDERVTLLGSMVSLYKKLYQDFQREEEELKSEIRLEPLRKKTTTSSVFWGSGEQS